MTTYKVVWKNSAHKELKRLPKGSIEKILLAVEKLSVDLNPIGSKKITGSVSTYRIRIGDYRVVYSIKNKCLVIEIIRVGHRKDIYKKLS